MKISSPSIGHKFQVIILAAGLSSRFGSQKLFAPFQGDCVLGHSINNAINGGATRLIIVHSSQFQKKVQGIIKKQKLSRHLKVEKTPMSKPQFFCKTNDLPERGMLYSLLLGLEKLLEIKKMDQDFSRVLSYLNKSDDNEQSLSKEGLIQNIKSLKKHDMPLFILLGDKPCLRPDTYRELLLAQEKTGKEIMIPTHNNKPGHPVLIKSLPFLLKIIGEYQKNYRDIPIKKLLHPFAFFLDLGDPGIILDIDRPQDLERAKLELGKISENDESAKLGLGKISENDESAKLELGKISENGESTKLELK